MIKPEIFKKKRNNIGAFIIVEPNPFEKGIVEEKESVAINQNEKEEVKPAENEELKEEEKKEEEKPKPEEEKKDEENKEEKKEETDKNDNINIPADIKELNKEPEEQSKFNIIINIKIYLLI